VHAVRGMSLDMEPGEILGLLGVNGAGKTTTLRMLCGEIAATKGEIHVCGVDVARRTRDAWKQIGYCPQFDALLDLLTVREHLELYGGIKGMQGTELQSVVAERLTSCGLSRFEHARAGQLSGGNKRKLSTAIATMGDPTLIVMDEPSCGLDPKARRAMWDIIQGIAGAGKSAILLTTHSMEEAEALSHRVGIMAAGRLATIGSPQQIKHLRGRTFELALVVRTPAPAELQALAAQLMPTAGIDDVMPVSAIMAVLDATGLAGRFWAEDSPLRTVAQQHACSTVALAEWIANEQAGVRIMGFLKENFGDGVECLEQFGTTWRYSIPADRITSVQSIFALIESSKEGLSVREYTVSQTSLEQVFNAIAKQAGAPEDD